MQTPSSKTPRRVHGKPIGKRVRSRRRRPINPDTAVQDNPHARSGDKRARRKIVADAPRQAAVRRDRKPASAPVESKPRVAREPMTKEQLAARSERRRQRHRTRKLAALAELLAELNLELPKQKEG